MKPSFTKFIAPIIVIASLLLTAFTAQAAQTRIRSNPANPISNALAFSAQKIAAAEEKVSEDLVKVTTLSANPSSPESTGSDKETGETSDNENEMETEQVITGTVAAVGTDSWTIGATVVMIDASTEIESGLGMGSVVKAEVMAQPDGSLLAKDIEAYESNSSESEMKDGNESSSGSSHENESEDNGSGSSVTAGQMVEFSGQLTAMNGSTWTVNGKTVMVSSSTDVMNNPKVGSFVRVQGVLASNGSIDASKVSAMRSDNSEEHSGSSVPGTTPTTHHHSYGGD